MRLVTIAAVLLMLAGCASDSPFNVCFMKVMGQTEDGMSVVAQHCMTAEAFKESQK